MRMASIRTLLFFTLFFCLQAQAQVPTMKVNGKQDSAVYLKKYAATVKITGSLAFTSIEMQFCNSSARVLEGELSFTLPDGVNVSGYALDINGVLRDAVPVEKEKGTQVFEAIEERRIDPGLLEKTEGNTFRTRIYPINPNACRTIRVSYTQELPFSRANALTYNLPLGFSQEVEDFSIDVAVFSKNNPEIASDCNLGMQFSKAEQVYSTHTQKKNYMPAGIFSVVIPKMESGDEVQLAQSQGKNYFLLNSYLQPKERKRDLGSSIAIIWDASLSGLRRDHKKESEFLDSLLRRQKNASVQMFLVSDEFVRSQTFTISNGNGAELQKFIAAIVYDGGSELNKINCKNITADNIYLFSDGISTFSDDEPVFGRQPVHCINAALNSNYARLKKWSDKTGGVYINLNGTFVGDAMNLLCNQAYSLINIKGAIKDVYPPLPVAAGNNICIAGISDAAEQQITLEFGYGNTVTERRTITLNENNAVKDVDIEKIWAQKKISFLEVDPSVNKKEITQLGKKYGIVTAGTSLIVLELLQDYIRYKIPPPAEFKAAYDQHFKQNQIAAAERRNNILEKAASMAADLKSWGEKKPLVPKQPQPVQNPSHTSRTVSGKIVDEQGAPVGFASIIIANARAGVAANANGEFTIHANITDELQISAVTFETKKITASQSTANVIVLKKSHAAIEEVVIVGYGNRTQNSPSSVQVVGNDQLNTISEAPMNKALSGTVEGVRVRGSGSVGLNGQPLYIVDGREVSSLANLSPGDIASTSVLNNTAATSLYGSRASDGVVIITTKNSPASVTFFTSQPDSNAVQLKEWTPARPYLDEMKKVSISERYNKYLSLRKGYEMMPVFYFDMANFFFVKGDEKTGMKILANLAELNFEDASLYKMLGYKLKEKGDYKKEVYVFGKVLEWRPHEPQSYRDYALALEDAGMYQQALDTLYQSLNNLYEDDIMTSYKGIEEIILVEMNQLISKHHLNVINIDQRLLFSSSADVRVVLNWNMNDTDIDLWVTDPNGEKCFYQNKTTSQGGRISDDFTDGYGPEQFLLKKSAKGKYIIEIDFYGDQQKKLAGPTTIMAEVYYHYGMPDQTKKIITIQLKDKSEREFLVGEMEF